MKLLKLIALLCIPLPGLAQTSVQVVTKVIEKDLPYTNGQRLHLNAQKADVTIKGWNRPTVSVTLRLVAKHPDRSVAEREVAYHQYTLQTNGNELDLSNRFVIPQRAGKLQSQLKAIYEVSVPSKAILSLNNSFGDVTLRELSGDVSLTFEFGRLTLDDVAGKLNITSEYGDVDGRGVNATLVCKAQKADISLLDLGGTSHIESRYGKLTIVPNAATLNALRVEAARTDIVFSPQRVADFRYDVMAAQSTIRVPEAYSSQVGSYGGRQTFTLQPAGRKTEIIIHNTYSPVTIQGERSFSSK